LNDLDPPRPTLADDCRVNIQGSHALEFAVPDFPLSWRAGEPVTVRAKCRWCGLAGTIVGVPIPSPEPEGDPCLARG
jgi:hypothetical protein